MGEKISIDPRVLAVREKANAAKEAFKVADGELLDVYGKVLREHGHNPDDIVVPGTWDCEKSPVGKCVYDFYQDPARDCCLYCGQPEERK